MATRRSPEQIVDHAFLLGGATALIFGVTLLIRQASVIDVGILLLGLWWLVQGILLAYSALLQEDGRTWRILLAVLGLNAALLILTDPVQTDDFLESIIGPLLGANALAIAGAAIYGGLRGGGSNSMLFGVVSGVLGTLLLAYPEGSFPTLVTVIGVILVIHGLAAAFISSTPG